MLQRLENAFAGFKQEADLVIRPTIHISLPQLGEKDDRKNERLKINQPEEVVMDKPADPFSEAPINMISMAWAEKGKENVTREEERRLVDKSTRGVIKLPEHPKAAIIKGMVLYSNANASVSSKYHPQESSWIMN
ncbi:hypothetical protein ACFX1W_040731 [Malus domestica]